MFLLSLAESFNLVSNVWYVKIMIQSVIGDVPRCIDNDSQFEIFVLHLHLYAMLIIVR